MAGSGNGWHLMELIGRPDGSGAELKAKEPLDFEAAEQRQGIRFQVQVTDQVRIYVRDWYWWCILCNYIVSEEQ